MSPRAAKTSSIRQRLTLNLTHESSAAIGTKSLSIWRFTGKWWNGSHLQSDSGPFDVSLRFGGAPRVVGNPEVEIRRPIGRDCTGSVAFSRIRATGPFCSSRGLLAATLPLFPRRRQLPIPPGMDLLLMPGEHVLRRDAVDGAVQADAAVMPHVSLHQMQRLPAAAEFPAGCTPL